MSTSMFTENDLKHMKGLGITEAQVRSQMAILKKSSSFLTLARPCTIGDGITTIPDETVGELISKQQRAARAGRFIKFVPASGAATRMFKGLLSYSSTSKQVRREDVERRAHNGDVDAHALLKFMNNIEAFPFFGQLREAMARNGLDAVSLANQGNFTSIVEYILTTSGLNYAALPKGLLTFHQYNTGTRTPLEEHLVEAAHSIQSEQGVCRLHFTISPEHEEEFARLIHAMAPHYEQAYRVRYDIGLSAQKSSTDTIAVDMDDQLFRDRAGKLLFRPGGHGALIENLNDLKGDLVYIKNIDNVVPDRLKADTVVWKKILGGYLLEVQETIFGYLRRLVARDVDHELLDAALTFTGNRLHLNPPEAEPLITSEAKREFLVNALNRPLRVCGVVRNVGEPGGGPFWVERDDGSLSLQIVERAQVSISTVDQREIWTAATHFNPVDLVCGVRDLRGRPFDLRRYVDHNAVFISEKSKDGRRLKALELPGLWNGAMANWNTVFVEVPITTFNPVKTVNDLLRKEHQPA